MLTTAIFGRLPEFLTGAAYGWRQAPGAPTARHRTALGGAAVVAVLALLLGVQHWAGVEVSIEKPARRGLLRLFGQRPAVSPLTPTAPRG